MGTKKGWKELDPALIGLAVLQALANAEGGLKGEVDLDLGGRWVRIQTDYLREMVVLFDIGAPPELRDPGEEG